MRYVLDASLALKWVVPESHSDRALALRDDFRNETHELLAPDIFPGEVAHTLTKLERRGIVAVGDSQALLDDVLTTCPALHPYLPHLDRAREISSQTRIGFFDGLYVALAESEGCELVTADSPLVQSLQRQFSFLVDLATM